MSEGYVLFDTPRGASALSWTAGGVTGVQLPEASVEATRARLRAEHPGVVETPPDEARSRVIRQLTEHLGGQPRDLTAIELDLSRVTPFRRRVYSALRGVAAGRTVSYAELAALAGSAGATRAVGSAMARNPVPIIVPCHRVLAAGGRIGGFSAHGGAQTKVDLLALEGLTLPGSALGLAFEPAEAQGALAEADPAVAALIERCGPLRLLVDPLESPFVALVKAIIYQQLTGKAAATIWGRVRGLFGDVDPEPEALLDVTDEELRDAGLSRAKVAGVKDLAAKSRDGFVPKLRSLRALSDEAIISRLTQVRGVGRWTVEMLLIFRLGRRDVFPADDYGVRKGVAALLGEPGAVKPKRAAAWAEAFEPNRTALSWYLWRAAELGALFGLRVPSSS